MATTTRTQQEPGLVTGLFTDKDSTERAYETLRARGYSDDEIDVIMSEETRNKYYANDPDSELGNKAGQRRHTRDHRRKKRRYRSAY